MARVVLSLILDTGDEAGELYLARDGRRRRLRDSPAALRGLSNRVGTAAGGRARRARTRRRTDASHVVRPDRHHTKEGELMTAVIQTEKLTKYYGKHRGIIDVDLEVSEGEAFGFLAPTAPARRR